MKQTKRFWHVLGGLLMCSDSAFAGTLGFGNGPTDLAFQGIVIGALSTLLVVLMVNLAWSFFRNGEGEAASTPQEAQTQTPAPAAVQYVAVPQYQAFPVMQPFWGQPPMAPYPSYPQQAPQTAGYPFPYPPGEVAGAGDGNRRGGKDAQDTGPEIRRREEGDPRQEATKVAASEGNQPHFDELLRSPPSKNSTRHKSPTSSQSGEARGLFDQIVRQNIQIREGLEKENPLASSKGAK